MDGPDGILPDLPTKLVPTALLPVMLGSNLDEGTSEIVARLFYLTEHLI